MGWLDFFAPAALGALLVSAERIRTRTALAVGACAITWGLLLLTTSPIPGTTPVLAGLALLYAELHRSNSPRAGGATGGAQSP